MATRKPKRLVGVAGVAAWLGVQPTLVTKWLLRYENTPVHDFEIVPGRAGGDSVDKAWLDTPERRAEWQEWYATGRPGQGAPGLAKPRRPKEDEEAAADDAQAS